MWYDMQIVMTVIQWLWILYSREVAAVWDMFTWIYEHVPRSIHTIDGVTKYKFILGVQLYSYLVAQ